MIRIVLVSLALSFAGSAAANPVDTGGPGSPIVTPDPDTRDRMRQSAAAIEGVSPEAVSGMTLGEQAALIAMARDTNERLYVRARAIGLVGALPNAEAEALWAAARTWPERELRVQAAWAQGLARRRTVEGFTFAKGLLTESESHLREVGVHLLFLLDTPQAVDVATDHLATESDPVIRRLIDRRLMERSAK